MCKFIKLLRSKTVSFTVIFYGDNLLFRVFYLLSNIVEIIPETKNRRVLPVI